MPNRRPGTVSQVAAFEPLEIRRLLTNEPQMMFVGADIELPGDTGYTFRVVYRDADGINLSTLDNNDIRVTGPNDFGRTARLVGYEATPDRTIVNARYRIAAPGGTWDRTDNGSYTVAMRSRQVRDMAGYAAIAGPIGNFYVQTSPLPPSSPPPGSGAADPPEVVNVADFGAFPNDGYDDTAAIQAAINSLPLYYGVPNGQAPNGGIVQFPMGTFQVSSPISVPSGIWLQGQGTSTVLQSSDTNKNSSVIRLVSPFSHGYNVNAAIQQLGIHSLGATAIVADSSIRGDLVDLRIRDLRISAGGKGIDLRNVRTYHSTFEHIYIFNPGGTAFTIGDVNGVSANNLIRHLRVFGTPLPGFEVEKGMVMIGGDYLVQNLAVEGSGLSIVPVYLTGSGHVQVPWIEWEPGWNKDNVSVRIENARQVLIDRLYHVDKYRMVQLINAKDVRVGYMSIDGFTQVLSECVMVDSGSKLRISTVNAIRDSGFLDHSRIKVEGVYNRHDEKFITNNFPDAANNFVKQTDLSRATFGTTWNTTTDYIIQMGDQFGAVQGSWRVENGRIRVDVTSNPNQRPVNLFVRAVVPPQHVGKRGVAWMRVDGRADLRAWTPNWQKGYNVRALNGLTSAVTPVTMTASDGYWIQLGAARGTYFLSKFAFSVHE